MAEFVANCPRCGTARITFDVTALVLTDHRYGWQHIFEAFSVCRNCSRSTIFVIEEDMGHDIQLFNNSSPLKVKDSLNNYFSARGFINLKDMATVKPPDHVPERIVNVFEEAATCLTVGCWNAAGSMFRACVDLATRPLLPEEETPGLNHRTRRDLGLRLPWLFDNGRLSNEVREISTCIREDGNDGAHQGTLTKEDAEDLLDFTVALLERLFTEPRRLEIAQERRKERRERKE
jgi:hypothetical protein